MSAKSVHWNNSTVSVHCVVHNAVCTVCGSAACTFNWNNSLVHSAINYALCTKKGIKDSGLLVVTNWCSSGHQVITKWSPSGYKCNNSLPKMAILRTFVIKRLRVPFTFVGNKTTNVRF